MVLHLPRQTSLSSVSRGAWIVAALSLGVFGLIKMGTLPSDLVALVAGVGYCALSVGLCARWRTERGVWMLATLLTAFAVFAAGILSFEVFDALRSPMHRLRSVPTPPGEIASMGVLSVAEWTTAYLLVCFAIWNWRLTR